MKKFLLLTAVALCVLGLSQTSEAAEKLKIKIASEGAFEPFNYTDPQGNLVGFDIDIAKALCEAMDAECTIVAQDWDGIIPGLSAGKYDAIVASMNITEDRKKKVDFTDRYYQASPRFVGHKKDAETLQKGDFKGKTIGVQRATSSADYLTKKYGDTVTVKQYDTQENANADLIAGRLDAILGDSLPVQYGLLNKPEGKDFQFVSEDIIDPAFFERDVGIAIRKGDKALQEKFNKAIKDIRANGTYKKINDKYFPFDIYGND